MGIQATLEDEFRSRESSTRETLYDTKFCKDSVMDILNWSSSLSIV